MSIDRITDKMTTVTSGACALRVNEAPAVRTLSWYITGLQVLYITSLVTYYKQITDSLHEQGTQKSHLA